MPETTPIATAQRPVRDGPDPTLSIVVISTGDLDDLGEKLTVLAPQVEKRSASLLVVHAGDITALASAHPDIAIVQAPASTSEDDMGALGMASANGDVVVIVRRETAPTEGWLEGIQLRRGALAPTSSAL